MKLKTKSGAKKRFSFTGSGKVKAKHSGKRHGMVHKSQSQIRELRKGKVLSEADTKLVHKYMPYNRKKKRA